MTSPLQELVAAARIAKALYDYGFSQSQSAKRQWSELKQEVQNLGTNLESLVQCVSSFQQEVDEGPSRIHQNSPALRLDNCTLLEICGDFRETIDECDALLRNTISLAQPRGLLTRLINIKWNISIQSDVERFSKRIASHNSKILLALEPVKLQLQYETRLSQQYGVQYLASGQESSTRRLEAKLCRILKLLGEDCEPDTPEPELLSIPPTIVHRLSVTFSSSRQGESELSLKDGSDGIRYHLDRSLGHSRPGDSGEAVTAMEKYLHLMKSIFLLDKVKASSEYASKVKTARNLLWFAVLQDLEDRCRAQFRRYLSNETDASRLSIPSDHEVQLLFQDDFAFWLDDDHDAGGDMHTGITLGHNDEISYLTLQSDAANEEHKLGIARLSHLQLELRSTKFVKNRGIARGVEVPLHVHLEKAVLMPIWAKQSRPQKWIVRFLGDADFRTEGNFTFTKTTDLHEFQQAITSYKVFYHSDGMDVNLRIHDISRDPKDILTLGKFEIWQDRELGPSASSAGALCSPSLAAIPLSPLYGLYPSTLRPSPTSESSWRRSIQGSFLSLPSSTSSRLTTSSRNTHTSTHTSPIGSPDGNTFATSLNNTTEPMLVLMIRQGKEPEIKYSLLGIKMDADTVVKPYCNSSEYRHRGQCGHVTVERENHNPLNILRIRFAANQSWNLASIGKYQQSNSRVEKPKKITFVQIELSSPQSRDAFIKRFDYAKKIWNGTVARERADRRDISKTNFMKET